MDRTKRTRTTIDADREAVETVDRLGRRIRDARRRRQLTQAGLAERAGMSQSAVSRIEIGRGGGLPLEAWIRLAREVGLFARFELSRDALEDVSDAGHLAMQELLIRLGRAAGYSVRAEAPSRPSNPNLSIDVEYRRVDQRRLVILEAWNRISDIGAGRRSFERKLAEARALASGLAEPPPRVFGVWVVRATVRNRALVARYPEVFTAAFPGSSRTWARAILEGTEPPAEPGLVWCDVRATRLFAWRR
jgi:transcriptional regulator with XRE-family HTH domain